MPSDGRHCCSSQTNAKGGSSRPYGPLPLGRAAVESVTLDVSLSRRQEPIRGMWHGRCGRCSVRRLVAPRKGYLEEVRVGASSQELIVRSETDTRDSVLEVRNAAVATSTRARCAPSTTRQIACNGPSGDGMRPWKPPPCPACRPPLISPTMRSITYCQRKRRHCARSSARK